MRSSYKHVHIQAEGHHFISCPRVHSKQLRKNPPYRRPFLHLQPEDAKCRGVRTTYRGVKWTNNLIIHNITDVILKQLICRS